MHDNGNKRVTFVEWLGYRRHLDYSEAKGIGRTVGVFAFILILLLLSSMGITLFNFFQASVRAGPYITDQDGSAIRNIGLVLAALFGAPFIVWRSIVAAKHVQIADESLFNDKINEAAQGLTARYEATRVVSQGGNETILKEWHDDLVARAAAIDRLEGLAAENKDASPRIVRMLATYVRGTFPCLNLDVTENLVLRPTPRMDLQKAIDTIGKVYEVASKVDLSHWRLDLIGCNFDGVSFHGGYFRAANFTGCRFEASLFDRGNFEGCLFYRSLLNYGSFRQSNLKGARFDHAILNRPVPVAGGFVSSINLGTLTGTTFVAADISALDHIGNSETISQTFGTKDTIISSAVRGSMLDSTAHQMAHNRRYLSRSGSRNVSDLDMESVRNLEETGFQHWSPYDSSDMATGDLLEKFFDELDMKKWPYYF